MARRVENSNELFYYVFQLDTDIMQMSTISYWYVHNLVHSSTPRVTLPLPMDIFLSCSRITFLGFTIETHNKDSMSGVRH